jgi:hypothetical protein
MSNGNGNNWGVPNRPKVSLGVSFPDQKDGIDGDIQIKQTNLGAKLFGKIGGSWYGAALTATEGNPVTRIGVNMADHLSIDKDSVDIYKNSVKVAEFGSSITLGNTSTGGRLVIGANDIDMYDEAGTNVLNIDTGVVTLLSSSSDKLTLSSAGIVFHAGGSDVMTLDAGNIAMTGVIEITSTGSQNVMMGKWSGASPDVDGVDDCIVLGTEAGKDLEDGAVNNIIIGTSAGYVLATGSYNTFIGYEAGKDVTAGSYGTCVGFRAGHNITTTGDEAGSPGNNTCVGNQSGSSITTGRRNVCIGGGTNVSTAAADRQIAIGQAVTCTGNNRVTIGHGSNTATLDLDGSVTSWAAASSDERFKENITTSTAGLSFINDLRPITYNWKKKKDTPSDTIHYEEGSDEPCLGHAYGTTLHGFIAQEVKATIDNHSEIKEGFKMWKQYDNGVQTVAQGDLIPILTKAVQELSAKIDTMQTEINTLKAE